MPVRPMLFCRNLDYLREFFGQMVTASPGENCLKSINMYEMTGTRFVEIICYFLNQ